MMGLGLLEFCFPFSLLFYLIFLFFGFIRIGKCNWGLNSLERVFATLMVADCVFGWNGLVQNGLCLAYTEVIDKTESL